MDQPNHMYQYSILSALMDGVASSGIPVSKLQPATQGLGTFTMIDGELVLLDHEIFQLRSDGSVRLAAPTEEIPFAQATRLDPTTRFRTAVSSKDSLRQILLDSFSSTNNAFIAYRASGRWKRLKMRAVKAQAYPGQPLSEMVQNQTIFDREDIDGTIVGFRSPESWQGISVAGEHTHFLADDRKSGGHVLELESGGEVDFAAAAIVDVHIELPTSKEFNEAKLTLNDSGIRQVEG